ncbi:MAG: S26 family signal peptidase [Sphingomonas sp.]|nr:S26 family signal peptidase [Sphingomonas sp.]MCX8477996.1 S26 family signal peptidase [Sphingomonas sp.]
MLALAALACALAATIIVPPAPRFVWNVSASAPRGLYLVGRPDDVGVGDMVVARMPAPWRRFAAGRRYLPANVPLVKRVAARPGDRVCASGRQLLVNGRLIGERRAADGAGRPMPWWNGCTVLDAGTLFLLMDDPASFDGRYFGPTTRGDVIGEARLLWRA